MVATGTLPAGTVRVRDDLLATPSLRPVRVRGMQSLKEAAGSVSGVARVALNLRGVDAGALARGMALVTPGAWTLTSVADVRLGLPPGVGSSVPPRELTLHIGAARTTARIRVLDGAIARLTLAEALPLHVGDRLLLRDPGAAAVRETPPHRPAWPPLTGATVLDVAPPAFAGRGAAAAAGRQLAAWPDLPSADELLRRHRLLRLSGLRAMGVHDHRVPVAGDWLADPGHWASLRERLPAVVAEHAAAEPLAAGMPVEAARAALRLPDRRLVEALAAPALTFAGGVLRAAPQRVVPGTPGTPGLPEPLLAAVDILLSDLAAAPFLAPEAARLRELGLGPKAIAAAARAGLLQRISDQIVLAPGADVRAAGVLAGLPQPFTASQARQAWQTTRRVAIPLLEYLDRAGVTRRLPDDRRTLGPGRQPAQ